jgi:hypothetical protein
VIASRIMTDDELFAELTVEELDAVETDRPALFAMLFMKRNGLPITGPAANSLKAFHARIRARLGLREI